ncbi:uncharacterized protein HI_0077-like [Schistocerca gregaria]|uniref:uncharacterized protein HI_0077-like n=1 Tax=Schistocerca gregaria TaxID=7010 RepID=UPI00211EECC6|nr:uncharacterized protein HI_0077-like [Schistocerca gregaria]
MIRFAFGLRRSLDRGYCVQAGLGGTREKNLMSYAESVLRSADCELKASQTKEAFEWIQGMKGNMDSAEGGGGTEWVLGPSRVALDMPSRPRKPILLPPREMPSHKQLKVPLADYLLHCLAHVELNAIDVVWDTILRFRSEPSALPLSFYMDMVSIAADEARHFTLLCARLRAKNLSYGSLPAHTGLWEYAEKTKYDFKGRIATMQLVQEARALDSWDRLVTKFKSQGDLESSRIIDQICREEIDHVKKGLYWFNWICRKENLDSVLTFRECVRSYVGKIPPPFNDDARATAGMSREWYDSLQEK